jgi:serine/threonine-protein kinase RsbT
MKSNTVFKQRFRIKGGDFINGGDASCEIGNILKEVGEAEMNVVIYARAGTLYFRVNTDRIELRVEDEGQGIKDIEQAMQEGYSTATDEIREMGFGAGMGLPNIKKNADVFHIASTVGKGTKLKMIIKLPKNL